MSTMTTAMNAVAGVSATDNVPAQESAEPVGESASELIHHSVQDSPWPQ
ncbi:MULTISPECIES: hypothetical protein [unclassified Streptomyces]